MTPYRVTLFCANADVAHADVIAIQIIVLFNSSS
jgi:hypothetical protein